MPHPDHMRAVPKDVIPEEEMALLLAVRDMVDAGRRVEVLRDKRTGELCSIEHVLRRAGDYKAARAA